MCLSTVLDNSRNNSQISVLSVECRTVFENAYFKKKKKEKLNNKQNNKNKQNGSSSMEDMLHLFFTEEYISLFVKSYFFSSSFAFASYVKTVRWGKLKLAWILNVSGYSYTKADLMVQLHLSVLEMSTVYGCLTEMTFALVEGLAWNWGL